MLEWVRTKIGELEQNQKYSWIVQFIKFGIVGVSNTLVGLGIYYLCFYAFGWYYQIGNVLSFIISVSNSYYWNSKYVFKMGERRSFSQHISAYVKTLTAYGSTFLLSTFLLWFWVEAAGISEGIAPLINLCITIPLNFVINKFWTFRKKENGDAPEGSAK